MTPDEQAIYDAYLKEFPSQKARLEKMSPAELKVFLQERVDAANKPTPAVTPTMEALIEQLKNSQDAPKDTEFFQSALGVTGGRQVSKTTGLPEPYTGFKPSVETLPDRFTQVEPRYFKGDEDLLNEMSRDERVAIQTKMKQAGILGKYSLGVVDDATQTAFIKVLEQANRTGVDYVQGLKALQASVSQGGSGGGLGVRVSNPDDLKKVINNSARLVLGRNVDPAMVTRLTQAYQQLQRQESGAAVQAPDAGVFAEKQIKQKFGAEADAYKFAEFAQTVLGGG